MTQRPNYPFNIFVPNLLNICIDNNDYEEVSGRMYHCYDHEPVIFDNIVELIQAAEKVFDDISFPQASTKTRSFIKKPDVYGKKPPKIVEQPELLKQSGEKATIITSVRFRQKSTWQGEFFQLETGKVETFSNMVDFIRKLDKVINE